MNLAKYILILKKRFLTDIKAFLNDDKDLKLILIINLLIFQIPLK